MDIDEARAATSPEGLALLAELAPYRAGAALTLGSSLREAGTPSPQVVLIAHMTSVLRERFDVGRVGRLRAGSMRDIEKLLIILLEL